MEATLWLKFHSASVGTPVNKLLKIYSKQAKLMSNLIEYCIDQNQASDPAAPIGSGRTPPRLLPPTAIPPKCLQH